MAQQLAIGISGPKAEKGPWEPDELVGFPPSPLHGVQGEPGTLLVAGKERTNRGIPREFPALFMHQGRTHRQETAEECRRTAKIVKLTPTRLNRNEYRYVYIQQELKPISCR